MMFNECGCCDLDLVKDQVKQLNQHVLDMVNGVHPTQPKYVEVDEWNQSLLSMGDELNAIETSITSLQAGMSATATEQELQDHITYDNQRYSDFNAVLNTSLLQLQNAVLDIQAGITNKVLDEGGQVDIESASTTAVGYTINNALGGRLTGQGGNYLLVGTGNVTVDGATAYNNSGIPLGIGNAPTFAYDVTNGQVVKSEGMTQLFFTPYISG